MLAEKLFSFLPILLSIYIFIKSIRIVYKYRKNPEKTTYKGLKTLAFNPFAMRIYTGKTAWYIAIFGALISVLLGTIFSLIFLKRYILIL